MIYILFPFENLAIRVDNSSTVVLWLLVILQLLALRLSEMGYGEPLRHSVTRVLMRVARVGSQLQCTYTFPLPFPISGRSAQRVVWRRWRRRFRAPLALLLRTSYLRSP